MSLWSVTVSLAIASLAATAGILLCVKGVMATASLSGLVWWGVVQITELQMALHCECVPTAEI